MLVSPGLASARQVQHAFDIPAGPLRASIIAVGEQGGVTIGVSDPTIARIPLPPLHATLTVRQALDRLLAGSPATYQAIAPYAFRVFARPRVQRTRPPAPAALPANEVPRDIIVRGSKRNLKLSLYPGSAVIIDASDYSTAQQARGSETLVDTQPILASTHLGPGRDKLFVRGIADSSFNGPTQSTVGQYLGDARLTFNAPDPDLSLYDMQSIEILEGPQGTLYGAGALGGVIRLTPNPPEMHALALDLSAGISATEHGGIGYDIASVANVPVIENVLALRGVAYRTVEAGYIDNPLRHRANINRSTTQGGRLALRIEPTADWKIDVNGVVQDIDSRDGQYAQREASRYVRSSLLTEPFDNNYALANVTLIHPIGSTTLTSSTSLVRHDLSSAYDATIDATPRLYRELNQITLVTNETRLARSDPSGKGWVAGVEMLHSGDRIIRKLGAPNDPPRISGTRNETMQAAFYGEATVPIKPRFLVTAGGRISLDDLSGEVLDRPEPDREHRRTEVRLLPSAGLLWRPSGSLRIFARYQMGYRAGGISVIGNEAQRFKSDELGTIEAGMRIGSAAEPLSASMTVSKAIWKHIQSDLIGTDGLPITTNIGNGRIYGLEATVNWRLLSGLAVKGALFLNDSSLYSPAPGFSGIRDASLPDIPDHGAYGEVRYTTSLSRDDRLTLNVHARYTGRSRLGVGPMFALSQGKYVSMSAGAEWSRGRLSFTADVTNLLNAGANIFAFGNPFGFSTGEQVTPLRPRTIRLGITAGF